MISNDFNGEHNRAFNHPTVCRDCFDKKTQDLVDLIEIIRTADARANPHYPVKHLVELPMTQEEYDDFNEIVFQKKKA